MSQILKNPKRNRILATKTAIEDYLDETALIEFTKSRDDYDSSKNVEVFLVPIDSNSFAIIHNLAKCKYELKQPKKSPYQGNGPPAINCWPDEEENGRLLQSQNFSTRDRKMDGDEDHSCNVFLDTFKNYSLVVVGKIFNFEPKKIPGDNITQKGSSFSIQTYQGAQKGRATADTQILTLTSGKVVVTYIAEGQNTDDAIGDISINKRCNKVDVNGNCLKCQPPYATLETRSDQNHSCYKYEVDNSLHNCMKAYETEPGTFKCKLCKPEVRLNSDTKLCDYDHKENYGIGCTYNNFQGDTFCSAALGVSFYSD